LLSVAAMLVLTTQALARAPRIPVPDSTPQAERFCPPLLLEPVEGLTTAMHIAPEVTGVPIGVTMRFCQHLRDPLEDATPPRTAVWTNAIETLNDGEYSFAVCPIRHLGYQVVSVQVMDDKDKMLWQNRMTVIPVDMGLEKVRVQRYSVSVPEVPLDENSTNDMTMAYYLGSSMADLYNLNTMTAFRYWEAATNTVPRFRTSVDRTVVIDVIADPVELTPLMELRADFEGVALGSLRYAFDEPGFHHFSIGPPESSLAIELETYRTIITSHVNGVDDIVEGEPTIFEAVTDPPGYENQIRWLSTTRWGTAEPVLGYGPTFTVVFDNTKGHDGRWLGVRADNAVFGVNYQGRR
jgi:hypothetical protein